MTSNRDALLHILNHLPEDRLGKLLEFARYLLSVGAQPHPVLPPVPAPREWAYECTFTADMKPETD
jgi:hypothetical protein